MQVISFAWLVAKLEKISTKEKIENYGFFAQYYTMVSIRVGTLFSLIHRGHWTLLTLAYNIRGCYTFWRQCSFSFGFVCGGFVKFSMYFHNNVLWCVQRSTHKHSNWVAVDMCQISCEIQNLCDLWNLWIYCFCFVMKLQCYEVEQSFPYSYLLSLQ